MLLIDSIIILQLTLWIWVEINISLIRSMMERLLLLIVPLIISVTYLVPNKGKIFMTSLLTMLHYNNIIWNCILLVYRILTKIEISKNRGRYNRNVIGYYNGRLPNGSIYLKINLWFWNGCDNLNKKVEYCKKIFVNDFKFILDPLFIIVDIFALVGVFIYSYVFCLLRFS